MNKLFIVLCWFYEGDSYLINTFIGVKKTYNEAKSLLANDAIILNKDELKVHTNIIFPEKEIRPNHWGQYGDVCKYEIREIDI